MHRHRRVPFVVIAAVVLCASIVAAAVTTVNPTWWLSCFSELGATQDVSSLFFNGGVALAGVVIALSALPVLRGMRAVAAAGSRARSADAPLLPLLIGGLGLSLILIGLLPLSFDVFAHERAANGALASSAGLLLMHRRHLRGLSRTLDRIAIGAVVVLAVGMAGLIGGVLSLTVFEAMAFGSVITWLHALETRMRRVPTVSVASTATLTANSQLSFLSPVWRTGVVQVAA